MRLYQEANQPNIFDRVCSTLVALRDPLTSPPGSGGSPPIRGAQDRPVAQAFALLVETRRAVPTGKARQYAVVIHTLGLEREVLFEDEAGTRLEYVPLTACRQS
jgi:hypothetical protein